MLDGTMPTFISRRDAQFKDYPPAAAHLAIVLPFYGDLTVWVRPYANRGWQFPLGTRRSGETISDAAKRRLWETARIQPPRLDLLGCLAKGAPKGRVAYVYVCEFDKLPWLYEKPEDAVEVGVFRAVPKPLEGDWCVTLLEAAQRARKTGLT